MTSAVLAGDLLVGVGMAGSGATAATGTSGAGTWVVPSGCTGVSSCAANDTTAGSTYVEYILSTTSCPATCTITVFNSGGTQSAVEVLEYTYTSGPISFDTGGTIDHSTACTSCTGIGFTAGSNNDVLVEYAVCAGTCSTGATGLGNAPWTNPADYPTGDACAGALNQTGTISAPNINTTSGRLAAGGISFKETGVATTGINKRKKLSKLQL